ncbi:MAG: IMP cyclohydrolase [Thermodesulfobacteriota bacterium]
MADLKAMYRTIQADPFPDHMRLQLGDQELVFTKRTWQIGGEEKGLRYGENPDQPAALYALSEGSLELGGVMFRDSGQGLVSALSEEHMLQAGKHPGKINLTDVDNGITILQYLGARPAAVILKHNNPCGAAWSDEGIATALANAYACDRIAAFGGTVVVNREIDATTAAFMAQSYFEVVAAPAFTPEAVTTLKGRKNLRILQIPGLAQLDFLLQRPYLDIKSLTDGGLVVQFSFRNTVVSAEQWEAARAEKDGLVVTARPPSRREADDLLFAWAVEAGVSSNSVIFARNGATVAIGTGEQDRVGCVELAITKAYTKYADGLAFTRTGRSLYELQSAARGGDAQAQQTLEDIQAQTQREHGGLPGSVLVSDGFFPFRDGVDVAIAEGVTAIAQPGGSIRDVEVVQAVNAAEPQVAMVFTGQRSFKH